MYYCFIKEELESLDNSDPLIIQANYAKHINKFCSCSLTERKVTDMFGEKFLPREEVFLRSTCENVIDALTILQESEIKVIENNSKIEIIQYWERLNLTKRRIVCVTYWDIVHSTFSDETRKVIEEQEHIFIKSRKKGISIKAHSKKLLNADEELVRIITENCKGENDDFLISQLLKIERDSLGEKEARVFVYGNNIINYSRNVHTVKHTVAAPFLRKAQEIVDIIKEKKCFPENYVLDIAKFKDGSETYFDIVEINPLSTALCYVNNSIFTVSCDDIENVYREYMFGFEYCYDLLKNGSKYHKERVSNYNYCYVNDGRYNLLEEN